MDDLVGDRTPDHSKMLSSLLTESEEFPKRRKVITSAFFKSKIAGLSKTITRVTLKELAKLQDGQTIDLPVFTEKLYSKIAITFLVGSENALKSIRWENDDGSFGDINIC